MPKRRAHGEGNLYQRSDGLWAARVSLGWEDGKRRRKVVYGKTQAEVRKKLSTLVKARDDGEFISRPGPWTGPWTSKKSGGISPAADRPARGFKR